MPQGGQTGGGSSEPGEPGDPPATGGGAGGSSNDPCKEPVRNLQEGVTGNPLDEVAHQVTLGDASPLSHYAGSTPVSSRLFGVGDPQTNQWSQWGAGGGGTEAIDPRVDMGRLEGRDPHTNEPASVPGLIPTIGQTTREHVAAYALFHPIAEGFAAVQFRPQCWIQGAPNFEHNNQIPGQTIIEDERVRPQVLTMRAFGGLGNDDYRYVERPRESRARGGTAHGGVLLSPPRFEMEDYLDVGVGASRDVDDVTSAEATDSLFMFAPGVRAAWGKPNKDGSAQDGAAFLQNGTTAAVPLQVTTQVSGAAVDLFTFHSDGGEVAAEAAGTSGFMLPVGTTAQRPTTLLQAGMIRWNSTDTAAEVYNGSAWTGLGSGGGGGGAITNGDYTATGPILVGRTIGSSGALQTISLSTDLRFDGTTLKLSDSAVVEAIVADEAITPAKLSFDTTEVAERQEGNPYVTQSTTTLTQFYGYTIPADTMPGRTIRVTLLGEMKQNSGSAQNMEFAVTLGGTEYCRSQTSISNNSADVMFRAVIEVSYRAAGQQQITGSLRVSSGSSATGVGNIGGVAKDGFFGNPNGTEDETTALVLGFEQRFVTSAVLCNFNINNVIVEHV
jgi:hypothetical protein